MSMNQDYEKVVVGKKLVWPRRPYVPSSEIPLEFVGREEELRLIQSAWIAWPWSQPLLPILVGPPGCGKNRMVYELAKLMGLPLYICQGYDNITAEDLACTLLQADEGRIEYMISTLATAMLAGGICFIDEIGKFPGKALTLLASVLDDRRYLDLELIGERIEPHPHFRFIAATNSDDLEALPEYIRSRLFPVVRIDKPDAELIGQLVQQQFPLHQKGMNELLQGFWHLWDAENPDELPSPRDAINIFCLAARLSLNEAMTRKTRKGDALQDLLNLTGDCQPRLAKTPMRLEHVARALRQFRGGQPC